MPSVFGVRPPAASRCVPSITTAAPPRVPWSRTVSPNAPATRLSVVPVETSIPSSRKSSPTAAVTSGSSRWISLRSAPPRSPAPQAAERLRHLKPDVPAAEDDEVRGDAVQFEGLDVGERAGPSLRPGVSSIRARAGADDDVSPRSVRVPPPWSATSMVLGPTKVPSPMTSSAPLARYL